MREFRKQTGRNKKPQVWYITTDPKYPETYITYWGVLGGKLQETADRPGSCGVEGHSDYQSPAQYVKFCVDREIRKKTEQGYVEYQDGKPLKEIATSIDFSKPLPKHLCFYKPNKEISSKKLSILEQQNRAIWTLKRDGRMHVAIKTRNGIDIYSRRMDIATSKFPHIVEAIESLQLPDNTILIGEMVLLNSDGTENFKGVGRVCGSKEELSLAYQGLQDFPKKKEEVLGKALYYVFDIPFWKGRNIVSTVPVYKRLSLIKKVFSVLEPKLFVGTGLKCSIDQLKVENKRRDALLKEHYIGPLKIYKTSSKEDLELAKQLKVEGFVLLDANGVYGDKGCTFDGKAQRPEGIWKRKPKLEEEVIIVGFEEGTGRNRGKLGAFFVEQFHNSKRVNCGKVGGGFTDEQRDELWTNRNSLVETTIKIEFDSRLPEKDGKFAFRFPVFKDMCDKTPEECIAQYIEEL